MNDLEKSKLVFDRNINRVYCLVKVYNYLKNENYKDSSEHKATDILRLAVVMLHSSFEEYYRSVISVVLPQVCDKDDIKGISFLGSNGKHKEKIEFSELLQWRGYTVDDVIIHSIYENLDNTSFNDYSDIIKWCKRMSVNISDFHQIDKINEIIHRRHKIVHEADNARSNEDEFSLRPIRESLVLEWVKAVCNLVAIIQKEALNKVFTD